MAALPDVDVLVVGKRSLRARRRGLRPGGRGPRGPRDEGRAPVLQLCQGPGRDPGRVRRGRLARAARRGRLALVARDGEQGARADPDRGGARDDRLARGVRGRVHAGKRRLSARALRWGDAEAPAPGRRPDGACADECAPCPLEAGSGTALPHRPLVGLRETGRAGSRRFGERTARGSRSRPARSCSPPADAVTARRRSAAS